jgi:hypothetical protein
MIHSAAINLEKAVVAHSNFRMLKKLRALQIQTATLLALTTEPYTRVSSIYHKWVKVMIHLTTRTMLVLGRGRGPICLHQEDRT